MDSDEQIPDPAVRRTSLGSELLRLLVVIHRWIGIVACLFFVVWFVSGLVLMYVHFPAMGSDEKLATLPPIEWGDVFVTPHEALIADGVSAFPRKFWLEMSGHQPVYRLHGWFGENSAISATDGRRILRVEPDEALQSVQLNLRAPGATLLAADLRSDQWTVAGYWDSHRPFHVIALNDPADSHYYVSTATGEIVLDTVHWERFWNYLGAVPHWIYFEFLRSDVELWSWVIIVLSAIGIFGALSGLWIGISRMRLRHRDAGTSISPFLGWMKWHHIAGIIGGVFLFTWIATGLLSMYPGGFLEQRPVTRSELQQFAGNASPVFSFPGMETVAGNNDDIRLAQFIWLGGQSMVVLRDSHASVSLVDSELGTLQAVNDERYYSIANNLMPDSTLITAERLVVGDEYWHTGFRIRKLPILKVAFDDYANTWFFIDPEAGAVAGILDDVGRLDRWANSGLHDIDLAFLHRNRPLWDIVVWLLMLAGLFISVSGVVIGVKRLSFDARARRRRRNTAARG